MAFAAFLIFAIQMLPDRRQREAQAALSAAVAFRPSSSTIGNRGERSGEGCCDGGDDLGSQNEFDAQLQSVDRAALTPIVRRALGSETVEVTHWDYQQIYGGIGGGVGGTAIYRFAGQGRDRDQAVPWSVILKALWAQVENRLKPG